MLHKRFVTISVIKKWLSKNRIIFEIVAAVLMITTNIIAISSNNILKQQNEILKAERRQAQVEHHPQFSFTVNTQDIPFSEYNNEQNQNQRTKEIYTITNNGGKIYEVEIVEREFLVITKYIASDKTNYVSFIPLFNRTRNFLNLFYNISTQSVNYEEIATAFPLTGKGLRNIRFLNEYENSESFEKASICIVFTIIYTDMTGTRYLEHYIPVHGVLKLIEDIPALSDNYIDMNDAGLDVALYFSLTSKFNFLYSKFDEFLYSKTTKWEKSTHSWYYEDNNLFLYEGPFRWISEDIAWLVEIDGDMLLYFTPSAFLAPSDW